MIKTIILHKKNHQKKNSTIFLVHQMEVPIFLNRVRDPASCWDEKRVEGRRDSGQNTLQEDSPPRSVFKVAVQSDKS